MNNIKAVISARRKVADGTYEISLKPTGPTLFKFEAGQKINLTLPDLLYPDKKVITFDFSIVTVPGDNKEVSIIFRESDSDFSRALVDIKVGSEVVVQGPYGDFNLAKDSSKPVVFIAGGVGIAPFMSIIGDILGNRPELQISLLYANSKKERVAYLQELEALAKDNNNFSLCLRFGYIDVDFIKNNVSDVESRTWLVSGPSVLIDSVTYLLLELGVKKESIFSQAITDYKISLNEGRDSLITPDQHKVTQDVEAILFEEGSLMASQIINVLSQSALISVTDPKGKIIYVNDLFNKTSGYSEAEMIGSSHNIVKSGYHDNAFYENLWNTILSGQVWRGEIKNKHKDGSFYWIDASISPVHGEEGEILYYIAVGLLITDKKNAEYELQERKVALEQTVKNMIGREEELENVKKATLNILEDLDEEKRIVEKRVEERTADIKREKNKLLQVTGNVKGGAVLMDDSKEVVFVNEKFYSLLSLSQINVRNESILRILQDYFEGVDIKGFIQRCFDGETFSVPEAEHGQKIYEIFFHCLRSKDDGSHVDGYFILIYDITESKLLERSKSELVAVASHQLRTPLTAMRGNVEMLMDESYGPVNSDQKELLSDINISTARLISMVNDMLDITKIEKGNLDMVFESVNVRTTLDSIAADLEGYTERRGVTVTIDVPEGLIIYGDKSRLRQVLQNLIDNAIKYSRAPGSLNISSHTDGDFAQIVLKDNGLGIPKLEQSRIFGRFYRATNTANSSSSGSGLGLYIVRSIVSQLGGDIWFESEENVGTTFFVTLPTKKIETQSH